MTKWELQTRFSEVADDFSSSVQSYLADCSCDADTKNALDEIARQSFYALRETQEAIIKYLSEN